MTTVVILRKEIHIINIRSTYILLGKGKRGRERDIYISALLKVNLTIIDKDIQAKYFKN